MKTVVKYLLKLWLSVAAKCDGGHFEKMALNDFVSFSHNFFCNGGFRVSQTSGFFHGTKLDKVRNAEGRGKSTFSAKRRSIRIN